VDGGNVVRLGKKVILTDKVIKENPGWSEKQMMAELRSLLKAEPVIIPAEPWDPVGHADGILREIGPDLVLRNNYRKLNPKYERALTDALHYEGIDFVDMPILASGDPDDIWDATGNYVNYLRVGKYIFLPIFRAKQDDQVVKLMEKCYPNCEIIPIYATQVAKKGGLINCVTWCTAV
jgi:agmatine deiminase